MSYKSSLWSIVVVMVIVGVALSYSGGYQRLDWGNENSKFQVPNYNQIPNSKLDNGVFGGTGFAPKKAPAEAYSTSIADNGDLVINNDNTGTTVVRIPKNARPAGYTDDDAQSLEVTKSGDDYTVTRDVSASGDGSDVVTMKIRSRADGFTMVTLDKGNLDERTFFQTDGTGAVTSRVSNYYNGDQPPSVKNQPVVRSVEYTGDVIVKETKMYGEDTAAVEVVTTYDAAGNPTNVNIGGTDYPATTITTDAGVVTVLTGKTGTEVARLEIHSDGTQKTVTGSGETAYKSGGTTIPLTAAEDTAIAGLDASLTVADRLALVRAAHAEGRSEIASCSGTTCTTTAGLTIQRREHTGITGILIKSDNYGTFYGNDGNPLHTYHYEADGSATLVEFDTTGNPTYKYYTKKENKNPDIVRSFNGPIVSRIEITRQGAPNQLLTRAADGNSWELKQDDDIYVFDARGILLGRRDPYVGYAPVVPDTQQRLGVASISQAIRSNAEVEHAVQNQKKAADKRALGFKDPSRAMTAEDLARLTRSAAGPTIPGTASSVASAVQTSLQRDQEAMKEIGMRSGSVDLGTEGDGALYEDQIKFQIDGVGLVQNKNTRDPVTVQRYFDVTSGTSGIELRTDKGTYRLTEESAKNGQMQKWNSDANRWDTVALDSTLAGGDIKTPADAQEFAHNLLAMADRGQGKVEDEMNKIKDSDGNPDYTPEQQWKDNQHYNRFLSYGRAKLGAYFDAWLDAIFPPEKALGVMCGDSPTTDWSASWKESTLWPIPVPHVDLTFNQQAKMLNEFSYINLEGEKEEITPNVYRYSITAAVLPSVGMEWKLYLFNSCTDASSEQNAEGHQFVDNGFLGKGQVFRKHYADAEGAKMTFFCNEDGNCRFNQVCFEVVNLNAPGEDASREENMAYANAQKKFKDNKVCVDLTLGAGFYTAGATGTLTC